MNTTITDITGLEILDSRGHPTVEAIVTLADGSIGQASVPSGASTGTHEAVESRDQDQHRYSGKGVLKAVNHINTTLRHALCGQDATAQSVCDQQLQVLDGTPNKARLGANTLLAVSLAIARAAANAQHQTLYQYLAHLAPFGDPTQHLLPVPLINILNGGMHADNNLSIQEFMILPVGAPNFKEALRCGAEIFQMLRSLLKAGGLSTQVGDEGGFAPNLPSHTAAIEWILTAIQKAGYKPGQEVFMGLDVASSEFYQENLYHFENKQLSSDEWQAHLVDWLRQYPIITLEDGMAENDIAGWDSLSRELGQHLQLVGDDLFVTHTYLLAEGIAAQRANAILIKPNQVGTLSETLDAVKMAKTAHYATIISHRSGETEDTFIADLAVATGAGQIKTGSVCRTDRVAKYNQLLRIEHQLASQAHYAGPAAFPLLKSPGILSKKTA